jgi:hypothetical protein
MISHEQGIAACEAWEMVFSHTHVCGKTATKRRLGQRSPRKCKFCGRTATDTTFRNDAHVIPAAFGNRSLFSLEECDKCNSSIGSPLEDDLAKFLSLPRAISRLPARNGTAKIRHPNQAGYVKGDHVENRVLIHQPRDDEGVHVEDDGNGILRLTVDTPAYRPANVARALGRMLLFTLDATETGFDGVLSWVRREVDWFPIPMAVLHFPSAGFDGVSLMVHRYTRAQNRRVFRVGFLYSSFLTVVPIPMDQWSLPSGLELLNYPPPPHDAVFLENTSVFMLTHNRLEKAGSAEAVLTYSRRDQVK